MENRIRTLKANKIKFIFILDGLPLKGKSYANQSRNQKRRFYSRKSKKVKYDNYDNGKHLQYLKHSKKLSNQLIYFFIDFLKFKKYDFIVAPYSADAQLVYMLQ